MIYFGPGVHDVTTIRPKSGQTVYLAGGAILRARIAPHEKPVQEKNWRGNKVYAPLIEATGVKGVKVCGRGILDLGALPWHARTAMWFGNSQDILVEGIVILDAPAWVVAMHNSKQVVVRNVKQICARENSDGVDICNSQDVLVEDCFLRNNDDEVCVKTLSPPPAMESKNIVVRRIVVWNDRARGLGITSETRANISNVLFQDCDIIHDFSQGGDCAALAVLVSDSGTMSDIRFENIRCEDVRHTLANCWIGADMWGHDKSRGHIKGVTFKDIQATGPVFPVSKLSGFDDAHLVEDVTFERLQIQGKPIGDAAAARLQTNSYVRRVKFIPASGRPQGSTDAQPYLPRQRPLYRRPIPPTPYYYDYLNDTKPARAFLMEGGLQKLPGKERTLEMKTIPLFHRDQYGILRDALGCPVEIWGVDGPSGGNIEWQQSPPITR